MSKQGHFVAIPASLWGHVRPLLHLCLNILEQHPGLHLTLLLIPSAVPKLAEELRSPSLAHVHPPADTKRHDSRCLIDRLQIVPVARGSSLKGEQLDLNTMDSEAADFAEVIPGFLKALLAGEDFADGDHLHANKFAANKANFILASAFQTMIPDVLAAVSADLGQPVVPTFMFMPYNAAAAWNFLAPAEQGGLLAKVLERVEKAALAGEDVDEVYVQSIFAGEGKVICPPGMTKMYDYELYPQAGSTGIPAALVKQACGMYSFARHQATRGLILSIDAVLEPGAKEVVEDMLGKEMIMVGAQFPKGMWHGQKLEWDTSKPEDVRVLEFLDEMEATQGKNSVVYVSFGTAFWPANRPELITHLLDSLMDNDVPFVFAHASFMDRLGPDVLEKINSRDNAIEVKFAPQWAVLQHPATGFFVAIMSEKPIVAFPFGADQGEFAYNLIKHGCAIDIKQVKTFKPTHFKKLYDRTEIVGTEEAIKAELKDIWERIRGEEGARMRENVSKVRATLKQSWESGEARKAMQSLARFY